MLFFAQGAHFRWHTDTRWWETLQMWDEGRSLHWVTPQSSIHSQDGETVQMWCLWSTKTFVEHSLHIAIIYKTIGKLTVGNCICVTCVEHSIVILVAWRVTCIATMKRCVISGRPRLQWVASLSDICTVTLTGPTILTIHTVELWNGSSIKDPYAHSCCGEVPQMYHLWITVSPESSTKGPHVHSHWGKHVIYVESRLHRLAIYVCICALTLVSNLTNVTPAGHSLCKVDA